MTNNYSIYESVCLMPLYEESLDVLCTGDEGSYGFQPASKDYENIEKKIELNLISKKIYSFLSSLSDREQLVARRIYWEDFNQTSLAKELGVSRPMVAKILNRVHRKAKEALYDLNPEYA